MEKSQNYFEINDLNEYINCVTKNDLGKYISRGENAKFNNITSSAFRYSSTNKFQDMTDTFYNEIGNSITNMQRENFTAFAQHHGIPTNLVDFSKSPLVSLFFACYETDKKTDDAGYVHFINSNRLIDITEMLKYPNSQPNIFRDLIHLDSSVHPIILQLYKYESTHVCEIEDMIIDWVNKLKYNSHTKEKYASIFPIINEFEIKTKKDYHVAVYEFREKILKEIIKNNQKDCNATTDSISFDTYIEKYNALIKKYDELTNYNYSEDILLMLLVIRTVCNELFDYSVILNKTITDFDLPFYFIYSPSNILSRIANQSSLFIYQLFYDYYWDISYVEKIKKRAIQNISPDFTIKINNKEKILKSLDSLGINLKFIYNDYDNIAKYIKTKELDAL